MPIVETVHKQSSAQRAKDKKYRKRHKAYLKSHRPHKLSQKQKDAVREKVSSGFFVKIAKLREALNLPTSFQEEVTLKHPKAYVASLLEWSTDQKDPRDFLDTFLAKDPSYTATDTGLCALLFETWMIGNAKDLFAKFVETLVEPKEPTFLALIEGIITPDDWAKLSDETTSFMSVEEVVRAGTVDTDTNEVADFTILECTPKPGADFVKPPRGAIDGKADVKPANLRRNVPESVQISTSGLWGVEEMEPGTVAITVLNKDTRDSVTYVVETDYATFITSLEDAVSTIPEAEKDDAIAAYLIHYGLNDRFTEARIHLTATNTTTTIGRGDVVSVPLLESGKAWGGYAVSDSRTRLSKSPFYESSPATAAQADWWVCSKEDESDDWVVVTSVPMSQTAATAYADKHIMPKDDPWVLAVRAPNLAAAKKACKKGEFEFLVEGLDRYPSQALPNVEVVDLSGDTAETTMSGNTGGFRSQADAGAVNVLPEPVSPMAKAALAAGKKATTLVKPTTDESTIDTVSDLSEESFGQVIDRTAEHDKLRGIHAHVTKMTKNKDKKIAHRYLNLLRRVKRRSKDVGLELPEGDADVEATFDLLHEANDDGTGPEKFKLEHVQVYYDMQIVRSITENDAIVKCFEKFGPHGLTDLTVSPVGIVSSTDFPGEGQKEGADNWDFAGTAPGEDGAPGAATPGQGEEGDDDEGEDAGDGIHIHLHADGTKKAKKKAGGSSSKSAKPAAKKPAAKASAVKPSKDTAKKRGKLMGEGADDDLDEAVPNAASIAKKKAQDTDYAAGREHARRGLDPTPMLTNKALAKSPHWWKGHDEETARAAKGESTDEFEITVVEAEKPKGGTTKQKLQAKKPYSPDDIATDHSNPLRYAFGPGEAYESADAAAKLEDADLRRYFCPGKSIVIDNVWWTIKKRDLDKDECTIVVSEYALKDGHKPASQVVKFSDIGKNINEGKWGGSVPTKGHIGHKQDREVRAKMRAKHGKRTVASITNESIATWDELVEALHRGNKLCEDLDLSIAGKIDQVATEVKEKFASDGRTVEDVDALVDRAIEATLAKFPDDYKDPTRLADLKAAGKRIAERTKQVMSESLDEAEGEVAALLRSKATFTKAELESGFKMKSPTYAVGLTFEEWLDRHFEPVTEGVDEEVKAKVKNGAYAYVHAQAPANNEKAVSRDVLDHVAKKKGGLFHGEMVHNDDPKQVKHYAYRFPGRGAANQFKKELEKSVLQDAQRHVKVEEGAWTAVEDLLHDGELVPAWAIDLDTLSEEDQVDAYNAMSEESPVVASQAAKHGVDHATAASSWHKAAKTMTDKNKMKEPSKKASPAYKRKWWGTKMVIFKNMLKAHAKLAKAAA